MVDEARPLNGLTPQLGSGGNVRPPPGADSDTEEGGPGMGYGRAHREARDEAEEDQGRDKHPPRPQQEPETHSHLVQELDRLKATGEAHPPELKHLEQVAHYRKAAEAAELLDAIDDALGLSSPKDAGDDPNDEPETGFTARI